MTDEKAKKIILTRELHEIVIVRSRNRHRAFCAQCLAERDFLSLDCAVQVSGFGTREILRRVEMREIHIHEATNGLMLVCMKSLAGGRREF